MKKDALRGNNQAIPLTQWFGHGKKRKNTFYDKNRIKEFLTIEALIQKVIEYIFMEEKQKSFYESAKRKDLTRNNN